MNKTIIDDDQEMCMFVPEWFPKNHWPLVEFPLMTLQIQFVVVFCVTQAIHRLCFNRFGIPPLLSQLLAGILLSPATYMRTQVVGRAHSLIFPPAGEEVGKCIATLGYALSLFMTAVKMDFTMITRTGKKPVIIGLSVLIVTGVVNTIVSRAYVGTALTSYPGKDAILDLTSAGTLIAITSFPVISALLSDLKLLNSELGRLALSSGIISDLASIAFNMLSKNISVDNGADKWILSVLGRDILLITFLIVAVVILRWLLKWMIKETPKGRHASDQYLALVFTLMLLGGLMTHYNGEFVLLGFFIVGAAIPEGPPLGSALVDKFDFLVTYLLQPFFITTTAMRANVFDVELRGVFARGQHLLVISAYATKIVICLLYGFVFKMTIPDALALAGIMSSKGFVDIGNFVMFRQSSVIGEETYSYLILVTTIASFVVPLAIKLLYNPSRKYAGYEKRCILHLNDEPHLRVLTCIYRPDNVSAVTNLLALSSPSLSNSMFVDVLHLIRLTGRATPIFISHNMQQKESYNGDFEDIIWAFNSFKHAYTSQALSMDFFTVVSPLTAMHDDICTLALDKLSSLIILPFHRKLDIDGHIELDDYAQRELNKSVLELAPCSVGVLVDRGYKKYRSSSSLSNISFSPDRSLSPLTSIAVQLKADEEDVALLKVAVIFIGGKDDQEAAAYAKRIANEEVKVQLIRVMGLGEENNVLSEMDYSALSGIVNNEEGYNNPHIRYMEKMVKDGSETAKYLWSLVEEYELIIVGRRVGEDEECVQTSGLEAWSEVPELGILGDLLAQPDLKCRTSILVLQQQN